jgi:hypothetical protein
MHLNLQTFFVLKTAGLLFWRRPLRVRLADDSTGMPGLAPSMCGLTVSMWTLRCFIHLCGMDVEQGKPSACTVATFGDMSAHQERDHEWRCKDMKGRDLIRDRCRMNL